MKVSAGQKVWIVFLLFSGTFINAVDRASLSAAAPTMIKDLNMTPAVMGVILSAFFWPYALLNIPAGALSDKYGAKKILAWSAVLWSICSAFTGMAASYSHVIFARIGVGMGESASFPVNAKVVNNTFPSEQRGTASGWYTAGLRLGFAACPLLMAYLLTHFGWRMAFYITGIASLGWVVLWHFTFKEPGVDPHGAASGTRVKIPWKKLLSNRTTLGLIVCKFFQDYLFYMFVTWLPAYLIMFRGFTIMKMGTYDSLMWLAGFFAQPLMGFVSDSMIKRGLSVTFSRKIVIVIMQFLAASVIAVGYIDDVMTAIWLLILAVACESASTSILWTTCAEVSPSKAAGSMAGLMNTAGAIAGTLAPLITGFVLHFTGSFQYALLFAGVMVCLAALTILFVVGELKPLEIEGLEEAKDVVPGAPDAPGAAVAMGH
jgi:ACS family glucarate transporter-like MFS transporter